MSIPSPPPRTKNPPKQRSPPASLVASDPYLLTSSQVLPTLKKVGWRQVGARIYPPASAGPVLSRDGVSLGDVVPLLIHLNTDLYIDLLESTLVKLDGYAMEIEEFWDLVEEAGWDCQRDKLGDGHHYYFAPSSYPDPAKVDFTQKHKTMVRHFELASELRRRDYSLYVKCLQQAKKVNDAPPPVSVSKKSNKKKKASASSSSSSTASSTAASKKSKTSKKSSSTKVPKAPPSPSSSSSSSSDESYWEEEVVDSDDELDSFTLTSSVRTFTFNVIWQYIHPRGWKWVPVSSIQDKSTLPSSVVSGNVYVAPTCDGGGIFVDGNDVVNYMDGEEGQAVELRREFLKSVFEKKRKANTSTRRKVRRKRNKHDPMRPQLTVNSDSDSDSSNGEGFVQLDKGAEVFFTGKVNGGKAKGLGRGGRRKTRKNTNEAVQGNKSSSVLSVPSSSSAPDIDQKALNKKINSLVKKTASLHTSWQFSLMASSSLLMYGYGSKRSVINLFMKKLDGATIIVEGGNENVDPESIVAMVERVLTNTTSNSKDNNSIAPLNSTIRGPNGGTIVALTKLTRYAKAVSSLISLSTKPINLIIHSFDGPQMRDRKMLEVICALKAAGANLIVSVDNVNALEALDWDVNVILNFRHIEMHTFAGYDNETALLTKSWENNLNSTTSTLGPVGGIGQILKSLAPRHAELMKLLATSQLSNNIANGVEYRVFRNLLKTKMVINSEPALKGLLVELVEHGLVIKKKVDGKEYLLIPHSKDTLNLILNF